MGALSSPAALADFQGLGDIPGGPYDSAANAVSADGLVVVGRGDDGDGNKAFRWTATGIESLGISGSNEATGVSGDGSVIVGSFSTGNNHREAFRWTTSGYIGLGTAGYTYSYAQDVSADGSTIVGGVWGAGQRRGFVWTSADGMRLLDSLPGGRPESYAEAVSADGTIAVGEAYELSGTPQAVRWDVATGAATGLGHLPGSTGASYANDLTPDGSVIVGWGNNSIGDAEAFRWTEAGGMTGLGGLPGFERTFAFAVSADGSVIVGRASAIEVDDDMAFYWTQSGGMQSLESWLSENGVDIGTWQLDEASDVSADGGTVVGYGTNPDGDSEAFIARAGVLVGVIDLSESVASLRKVAHLPTEIGRAAITSDLPGLSGLMGWSAGPVYQHVSGSRGDLGGASLTWRKPGLAVSGQLGLLDAETGRLHVGGRGDFRGAWVGFGASLDLASLTNQPAVQGLELDAGIRYGRYDTEIRRNYLNGVAVESARGDTDSDELTLLARLGWRKQVAQNLDLIPHLQWLYNRTEIDAYTETGGAMAGQVSAMKAGGSETAIGLTAAWQARPDLELRARYGLHHLNDDDGSSVMVSVPGLGNVVAGAADLDSNWHEFGMGIDWAINNRTRLNASLNTTAGSDYPENWSAALSLYMGF